MSPAGEPRPGATIELVDGSGAVVDRTLSEFDGYFLIDRVPYGSYTLRLATGVAATLGVRSDLGVSIKLGRDHATHQLGPVRLQPSAAAAKIAAVP